MVSPHCVTPVNKELDKSRDEVYQNPRSQMT